MNQRRDLKTQSERLKSDSFLASIAEESITNAEFFFQQRNSYPPERVLEVGSAGGLVHHFRPNWVTSDIIAAEGVDQLLQREGDLPFADNSFEMIFLQDTLHHISDLEKFFEEARRVLVANGLIFAREPAFGPVAQLIFRIFHPEEFSLRRLSLSNRWDDAMKGNQALAWGIARNHRGIFTQLRRDWEYRQLQIATGIAFVLSGGATFRTAVPSRLLRHLHEFEKRHPLWLKFVGVGCYIAFTKSPSKDLQH
jgi:SAM-dependent methyltransferase